MRLDGLFGKMVVRATALCLVLGACASGVDQKDHVLIRDITTISGVRDNPLVGYGIVIGLRNTGDSQQTVFTVQTLANVLQRMGLQIPPATVQVRNVASVIVTGNLAPFSRPGTTLDVTVASVGDAKSLEGGVLLLTALRGDDGEIYAQAQGPLTLGGYTSGGGGNTKQVNHPTVGRVPAGGTVERDASFDIGQLSTVSLVLRNSDFTLSRDVAKAINQEFGSSIAQPVDSRRIDVSVEPSGVKSVPVLIARIQNLAVSVSPPARVVMNERTGTIVMGGDVKLSAVSVLHGDLTVEVTTAFSVSQPSPLSSGGETKVVPQTTVKAEDAPARSIQLKEGANVEELINGLHTMGASARDIVAILQAIKAAGGLQADLEIL